MSKELNKLKAKVKLYKKRRDHKKEYLEFGTDIHEKQKLITEVSKLDQEILDHETSIKELEDE